jgi:hypothetical protein
MRKIVFAFVALLAQFAPSAQAAEITAFISGAARNAFDGVVPLFERESGHKVTMHSDIQQVLSRRIDAGEAFDILVTSIDVAGLIKQGKVAADSRTTLGRTGVGVAVRHDARRLSTMNCWPVRSDSHCPMSRALMSFGPPAAKPTTMRTGRDGYVCAHATCDTTGSAAAPAARCRNLRRGSFIGSFQRRRAKTRSDASTQYVKSLMPADGTCAATAMVGISAHPAGS